VTTLLYWPGGLAFEVKHHPTALQAKHLGKVQVTVDSNGRAKVGCGAQAVVDFFDSLGI
jgi:hypothetical protein